MKRRFNTQVGVVIAAMVALLSAAGLILVILGAGPSDVSGCWQRVPFSNGSAGTNAGMIMLNSITSLSTGDTWAVGAQGDDSNQQARVFRLDKNGWEAVSDLPVEKTYTYSPLLGVQALSPDNVWAVGTQSEAITTPGKVLIIHWDGTKWSSVPGPSPAADGNKLDAISAISADDIWAAGYTVPSRSSAQPLLLHWDGKSWTEKPAGILEDENVISGLAAIARNDVWAVGSKSAAGYPLTLHWNGTRWQVVAAQAYPDPAILQGVTATGPGDVWAVGYEPGDHSRSTLALRWDGQRWNQEPSPSQATAADAANPFEPNANLMGVSAVGPNDVWAVGSRGQRLDTELRDEPFVLHWDGAKWNVDLEKMRLGAGDITLNGVTANAGVVWAIGSYSPVDQLLREPVILRRDTACAGQPR